MTRFLLVFIFVLGVLIDEPYLTGAGVLFSLLYFISGLVQHDAPPHRPRMTRERYRATHRRRPRG